MKLFDFIKKIFRKQEEIMLQAVDRKVETELALEAAKQRVAKANEAILHFRQQHQALVNGDWTYIDASLSNRASLDRELRALFLEADEAHRFWSKCQADFNACRPRPSCIAPAQKIAP